MRTWMLTGGASMAFWWLRPWASTAGGTGSSPGCGTKPSTCCAVPSKKKMKEEKTWTVTGKCWQCTLTKQSKGWNCLLQFRLYV